MLSLLLWQRLRNRQFGNLAIGLDLQEGQKSPPRTLEKKISREFSSAKIRKANSGREEDGNPQYLLPSCSLMPHSPLPPTILEQDGLS